MYSATQRRLHRFKGRAVGAAHEFDVNVDFGFTGEFGRVGEERRILQRQSAIPR